MLFCVYESCGVFGILRKFLCIHVPPPSSQIPLRVKLRINPCRIQCLISYMKLFESMYKAESCSSILYKSSMHRCNWSHEISQLKQVGLLKEEILLFLVKMGVISLLHQLNYLGKKSDTHSVSFKPT